MKAFERITISGPEILDYPATARILANLKKYNLLPENYSQPEVVNAEHETQRLSFEATKRAAPENHPVALGKRILHLTTQPGTTVKQCPGTNNMLCCHYHIINMVSNCPFDCSYCYLQTYLNQPLATFFVNEEDILEQVRQICDRPPVSQLRIGTGELADSLAWDHITGFSERVANLMADYPNVRLELKTKSKNVEQLFGLPKKDHVVIGWSMNPPEVINAEEHGTARFEERVAAAADCARRGFGVAFHFDPMIQIENWQERYERTAVTLLSKVPHEAIRWISIGGLRYQPQLRAIALRRRPETILFDEENVQAKDGKVRYLRSIRTEMFQHLNSVLKREAPSVYTYLCMESMPVWEKALGRLPDRTF